MVVHDTVASPRRFILCAHHTVGVHPHLHEDTQVSQTRPRLQGVQQTVFGWEERDLQEERTVFLKRGIGRDPYDGDSMPSVRGLLAAVHREPFSQLQ